MNIFCDLHHSSLYTSFQLLFEKRLGHTLYRPIGTQWFDKGFWHLAKPYNDNPDTIQQYLGIRDVAFQPKDGTHALNDIKTFNKSYKIQGYPYDHNAITFEQFLEMDIDIIVASYQPHYEAYTKLRDTYKPDAKVICHAGNEWPIDFNVTRNLLSSTLPFGTPNNVNVCWYHQEFDLNVFKFNPPSYSKTITSFVNTLGQQDLFKKDWEDFLKLESFMPEYQFKAHGASTRDGLILEQKDIADKMSRSAWGLHLKHGGDGYGHTLFNWFACGRPLIFRGSQYKNRLGGLLLEHKVTGLDIDKITLVDVAKIITSMNEDEYNTYCDNVYNRFTDQVNFDEEEKDIKLFLKNLQ